MIGQVDGFPIPIKGGYQLIYENFEEFNGKSGTIKQFTSKGNFIADFKVVSLGNVSSFSINTIGTGIETGNLTLKASTHATAPIEEEEDGWWSCTTECYREAKEACGSDDTCQFLCDLVDIVGLCTITIAAACAIYCV